MFSMKNHTLTTKSSNSNDRQARIHILLLTFKMTHQIESADIQVVYLSTSTLQTRYVITSRIPTVTYEEIAQSLVVRSKILEIFREILTENDKQLITNIFDSSKKVIITKDQLIELLVTVLSMNSGGVEVSSDDITIKYSEDILSTCLKISVSPFKNIVSIKVFEQEPAQVQPDIYTALASTFKISLETFYQPVFDSDVCC